MVAPLEIERRDGVVVARAGGDVDIATADFVRDRCVAAMSNQSVGLVLDLSGSEYVDSAGIRALFAIAERLEPHRQRLALVVPPGAHARRVLSIVDMESSASIDGTLEAALDRLRPRSAAGPPP